MQPFVCPHCGHESAFDPWVASARCPRCGYTPSSAAQEGPEPPFFGESDRRLSWGVMPISPEPEGAPAAPAAWLYTCPRCGHESLILRGAPLRCRKCGRRPRKGESQPQGIPAEALQEFLGIADGPPRWLDLSLQVGGSEGTYHRLREILVGRGLLRAFECPSCGRQSVFRSDESPYCSWCGYALQRQTPSRTRYPAAEGGKRAGPARTDATVRYAKRDPGLASISGNEGLCIGTTGVILIVLLMVIVALYVMISGS